MGQIIYMPFRLRTIETIAQTVMIKQSYKVTLAVLDWHFVRRAK